MKIEEILARFAEVTGLRKDSEIARRLSMSPQGISNARTRGTVPYEKICLYGESAGLSIDYLLLGKGIPWYGGGGVDPGLLKKIGAEFSERNPELRKTIGELGYAEAALIYNRIIKIAVPEEKWDEVISDEVDYLVQIREQDRLTQSSNEVYWQMGLPVTSTDSGEAVDPRANVRERKRGEAENTDSEEDGSTGDVEKEK